MKSMRGEEVGSRSRRGHAGAASAFLTVPTSPYSLSILSLPLTTHTTTCGDVFMSPQGAPDAPFEFRCGLPVATKAPILVILKSFVDDPPRAEHDWPSTPQFIEPCLLYLIQFVFDSQRRILLSSSRHLVMTPRCMCAVLISTAKTAYAATASYSLSCLALYRPSQTLLSLLYEALAGLLLAARFCRTLAPWIGRAYPIDRENSGTI